MPKERNYKSILECVVRIKGITTRPIPFSQLRRRDGEWLNPEELFADCRVEVSEEERLHQERLDFIMADIIDWAISQLSWANAETIRAIHFEGKTVKQYSREQCVTVYAVYKRLERSYPVLKEIIIEEVNALDPVTRVEIIERFGISGCDE